VKDFMGQNNRYGQVAVPDFLDYLCSQSSKVNQAISYCCITRLQCSQCQWLSEVPSSDTSLKLYIPADCKQISLHDLITYNSNSVLSNSDAVFCGKCNVKTAHTLTREYGPELFVIEIIRVTGSQDRWLKNSVSISFPCSNLILPGFSKPYKVVGSCHHWGSLNGGHWFTKELTNLGWYELDDLKAHNYITKAPGLKDNSVAILLLIAEDRFNSSNHVAVVNSTTSSN
jgi:ubiquitin C-terminal hydrolase